MSKKYLYIDMCLFVVSILLIGLLIYFEIGNEYLMVAETIATALFSIGIILKRYRIVKAQYFLLVLFIILLFQVTDFSYTVTNGDTSTTYHDGKYHPLINPIVFIILVAYLVVNRKVFGKLIINLACRSEEERKAKFEKMLSFYYDQFNKKTSVELKDMGALYKDYPKEAQAALLKIQHERELNFLDNV